MPSPDAKPARTGDPAPVRANGDRRERPIIFSAEMIRAILAGRKSQTRRLVKPQPREAWHGRPIVLKRDRGDVWRECGTAGVIQDSGEWRCPHGRVGERLWVRETFWPAFRRTETSNGCVYRADYLPPTQLDPAVANQNRCWQASNRMPSWASRLMLEITDVRVERLNDITEADAIAEGVERNEPLDPTEWDADEHGWLPYCSHHPQACECFPAFAARESFRGLWQSIHGPDSWQANPYVWCLTFRRVAPSA